MPTAVAQLFKKPILSMPTISSRRFTTLPVHTIQFKHGHPTSLQKFRDHHNQEVQLPIHLKDFSSPSSSAANLDFYENLKKYENSAIMQCECRFGGERDISVLKSYFEEHGFHLPIDMDGPEKTFHRINAPLRILLESRESREGSKLPSLYAAQMPIDELPLGMVKLFPVPTDIINCGKGDIYGSSVWIGNPPTYTPLHKDPNPNIFTQYLSSKTFRLISHTMGLGLFYNIQKRLGQNASASIRGVEMMDGPEFNLLEKAVWDDQEVEKSRLQVYETLVQAGDSLFIPKGWWHSVKSSGDDLNVSVNWWFR